MTVIQPNSISGITSITAQGDTINIYKSDGTAAGLLLNGVNVSNNSGVSTFANIVATNINSTGIATFAQSNPTNLNVTGVATFASSRPGNLSISGITTGLNVPGISTLTSITSTNLNVSGVTTVSAGTTSAPSITPSGDSNTGIFFPNADTVAIAEGGVEVLRITSDSNVGIATTNPTQRFQVGLGTNSVSITGLGSIGVGTASPTAKLHVYGNSAGFIGTASTTSGSGISTVNLDFGSANNFSITLTGNYTIANPTNLVVGQSGFVSIIQDGTGSRTASWGSFWDFANSTAPTLTTTANGVDVLAYYVRTSGAGGTSIVADAILGIGTV